jgi:hypothetical protein
MSRLQEALLMARACAAWREKLAEFFSDSGPSLGNEVMKDDSEGERELFAALCRPGGLLDRVVKGALGEGIDSLAELLERHFGDLQNVLSAFNWGHRLRLPKGGLSGGETSLSGVSISRHATPADFVREELCWSAFGTHNRAADWLGHGRFWRSRFAASVGSGEAQQKLENAAGNAMNDFDTLEGGLCRLKRATCVFADFGLIRRDFPVQTGGKSDEEISRWLVSRFAVLSHGQVERLRPGTGDHATLLGIETRDDLDALVDTTGRSVSGFRYRSGGRAVTLPVSEPESSWDGTYSAGDLEFSRLYADAKGVGTHEDADFSNAKVTGLLGFADALREVAFQRLVQRLVEIDDGDGAGDDGGPPLSTVQFYAIIDTGLRYEKTNPATGWTGERCVIAVRQQSSRFLPEYDAMSFAGNFSGRTATVGAARRMRKLLHKHGVSAEFVPLASYLAPGGLSAANLVDHEHAAGNWNLQADATGARFMDHSDYFVLPDSPLPQAWKMSIDSVRKAFVLGAETQLDRALESGGDAFCRRIFSGCSGNPAEVRERCRAELEQLSRDANLRDAAGGRLDASGLIKRGKPGEYGSVSACWGKVVGYRGSC